jgi:hypothetical protein
MNLSEIRYWDWKSIYRTILVFLIFGLGLFFYVNFADRKRDYFSRNQTSLTKGTLTLIKAKNLISLSETGNEIKTYFYEVKYTYNVKNKLYTNFDLIPNSPNNQELILSLFNSNSNKVRIKFDPNNPQESSIQSVSK